MYWFGAVVDNSGLDGSFGSQGSDFAGFMGEALESRCGKPRAGMKWVAGTD